MEGEWTGIMRALKLLVVIMGVLIVAGTVTLVTVVVNRTGRLGTGAERPISIPAGFRVTATEISGDRLLVRLDGRPPGATSEEVRLLVLDLSHGGSPRTVRLIAPEKPSSAGAP